VIVIARRGMAVRTVMVQVKTWFAQLLPRRRFAIWPPSWLPAQNNMPYANVYAVPGILCKEKE